MIPVQDNWLHIDNNFIHSCEQINNNNFQDNFTIFKKLGLFKLLLPTSLGGRSGHLQDLLECQLAISERCLHTSIWFTRCAVAPYLIKKFGDNVFEQIFGADNEALVYLNYGNLEDNKYASIPNQYDYILLLDNNKYSILDLDRKIIAERSIRDLTDHDFSLLPWFQIYNRVLTTSCLGGLTQIINLAMNIDDRRLYTLLGTHLAELDEMKLCLHRNINHALLHVEQGEEVPMYDRVKYKVQSGLVYSRCNKIAYEIYYFCETLKNVYRLDNDNIKQILNQMADINIEHLSQFDDNAVRYIRELKSLPIQDLYL